MKYFNNLLNKDPNQIMKLINKDNDQYILSYNNITISENCNTILISK